jgi:type I restriction enzyme M protein
MSTTTQNTVNKAWNIAHVLQDDGLSCVVYTEQITLLLFLKMADELTKPPCNRKHIVPPLLGWQGRPATRWERSGSPLLPHPPAPKLDENYRAVKENAYPFTS